MWRSRLRLAALAVLLVAVVELGGAGWIVAKARLGNLLLERAFQARLAGQPVTRPWPWADVEPVARLELPGHERPMVVLGGHSGEALAFGPGMVAFDRGSSRVRLVSAHRDTHFRHLYRVTPGVRLRLQDVAGTWRVYETREVRVVDTRAVGLELVDGDWLVLSTCYPPGGLEVDPDQRLLVVARSTTTAPPQP